MVMTEQGSDVAQQDYEGLQPTSRPRRTRILIATGVALVLALGGGGGIAYASWDSRGQQAIEAARATLVDAEGMAREARAAADGALEASAGKVADDTVRAELAALLAAREPWQLDLQGTRAEKTAAYRVAADLTAKWTDEVEVGTAAVVAAQAAWELEQATADYTSASAALAAALDAGAGVLASSEGKVSDNAVRQALSDSIATGSALSAAALPAEVDAIAAATAQVAEATAALSARTAATTDAQAAWQAEQDRIAEEQAAAARAAAAAQAAQKTTRSSGDSTGSPAKRGSTSGGSSAIAGSGSAPRATGPQRLGSSSGSNFGTGTAPACTTPSCGITF
jgi:hypothetical protein